MVLCFKFPFYNLYNVINCQCNNENPLYMDLQSYRVWHSFFVYSIDIKFYQENFFYEKNPEKYESKQSPHKSCKVSLPVTVIQFPVLCLYTLSVQCFGSLIKKIFSQEN